MSMQATGARAGQTHGITIVEDIEQVCPHCHGPVVRIQPAGLAPLLECVDAPSHDVPRGEPVPVLGTARHMTTTPNEPVQDPDYQPVTPSDPNDRPGQAPGQAPGEDPGSIPDPEPATGPEDG